MTQYVSWHEAWQKIKEAFDGKEHGKKLVVTFQDDSEETFTVTHCRLPGGNNNRTFSYALDKESSDKNNMEILNAKKNARGIH